MSSILIFKCTNKEIILVNKFYNINDNVLLPPVALVTKHFLVLKERILSSILYFLLSVRKLEKQPVY